MTGTMIKTDWKVTAQQVYDNNNLSVNQNAIFFDLNEKNIHLHIKKCTDSILPLYKIVIKDNNIINISTGNVLMEITSRYDNEELILIITELFKNKIKTVNKYLDKEISTEQMQQVINEICGTNIEIKSTAKVTVTCGKASVTPIASDELNQVISIVVDDINANIKRTYCAFYLGDKYYIATQVKSDKTIINNMNVFNSFAEIQEWTKSLPLPDAETICKVFDEIKEQVDIYDSGETVPAIDAWLKGSMAFYTNYGNVRIEDILRNVQGKNYSYNVVLTHDPSTSSYLDPALPTRRAIKILARDPYVDNRKKLGEVYTAFNKNVFVAEYYITKTDMNKKNEVTISCARVFKEDQVKGTVFYNVKDNIVSQGISNEWMLSPIKPMLTTLFNKENYKDFESFLTFSVETPQEKVVELQDFITRSNNGSTWVK